jgi:hypothetical protein
MTFQAMHVAAIQELNFGPTPWRNQFIAAMNQFGNSPCDAAMTRVVPGPLGQYAIEVRYRFQAAAGLTDLAALVAFTAAHLIDFQLPVQVRVVPAAS